MKNRLHKAEDSLKKNILKYKIASDPLEKEKWKKEAAHYLRRKKVLQEYLGMLNRKKHERELKKVEKDIENENKELV